jgi:hypothetical protein
MRAFIGRVGLPVAVAAMAFIAAAPVARADVPILTFGFTDLNANYAAGAAHLDVDATAISDGDVTRLLPVVQTAVFDAPSLGLGGGADVKIDMDLFGITPLTALASGSFVITDANGDTITGDLSGTWMKINPLFASFSGVLTNVYLNDNEAPDATFDGTESGSFGLDLGVPAPYEGAIVELAFPNGGWFDSDLRGVNTLVSAQIIPEPASLGLLLIGGLGALRRRRA